MKDANETMDNSSSMPQNWRSSIRKKLSRLSKRRPASFHFDGLSMGQSSQSLFYTDDNFRRSKNYSSNSLSSQNEASCKHDVFPLPENEALCKTSEENSNKHFKERFKKFVKTKHLSASISSISNKFKNFHLTPEHSSSMFTNLRSLQSIPQGFVHHFPDLRESIASNSMAESNSTSSVVAESNPLKAFKVDEAFASFRHIDSSSDEDQYEGEDNASCVRHRYPCKDSKIFSGSGVGIAGNTKSETQIAHRKTIQDSNVDTSRIVLNKGISCGMTTNSNLHSEPYRISNTISNSHFSAKNEIQIDNSFSNLENVSKISTPIVNKLPEKTFYEMFHNGVFSTYCLSLKVYEFDCSREEHKFQNMIVDKRKDIQRVNQINGDTELPYINEVVISACISLKNPGSLLTTNIIFGDSSKKNSVLSNNYENISWFQEVKDFQAKPTSSESYSTKLWTKKDLESEKEIKRKSLLPLSHLINLRSINQKWMYKVNFPLSSFSNSKRKNKLFNASNSENNDVMPSKAILFQKNSLDEITKDPRTVDNRSRLRNRSKRKSRSHFYQNNDGKQTVSTPVIIQQREEPSDSDEAEASLKSRADSNHVQAERSSPNNVASHFEAAINATEDESEKASFPTRLSYGQEREVSDEIVWNNFNDDCLAIDHFEINLEIESNDTERTALEFLRYDLEEKIDSNLQISGYHNHRDEDILSSSDLLMPCNESFFKVDKDEKNVTGDFAIADSLKDSLELRYAFQDLESLSLNACSNSYFGKPNSINVDHLDEQHVRWVLSHGEDLLNFHQSPQNTLLGITRQVDNFNHFFQNAKRESDKGCALLNQESESSAETQELTKSLRRHLSSFADRLHLTKDQLEDTAKCYLLLDKAYEWALEAMKVVGRFKSCGIVSPDQVSAAANAIGELLQENPPVAEETFNVMTEMAERLNNQTLLQQCKMAQARCDETMTLMRNRQSALMKTRRQMSFDCQSFVDLSEVLGGSDDSCSMSWFTNTPLNHSGRRRSGCSIGSRPSRDPLSRSSSIDTDDDSVFSESMFNTSSVKSPLEAKCSLGGIKELRESVEDVRGSRSFTRDSNGFHRSSRTILEYHRSSSPALNTTNASSARGFSSSSSSCSSSDSSGPVTAKNLLTKDHLRNSWRFADTSIRCTEEPNDSLDESVGGSSTNSKSVIAPSAANSHLLIRGSQINLSNSEDLTDEEVRKNKTLLLIMQELIQTERDYVNSLEYIIENYIPELLREDIPQALRGQRNAIFGNIEKIYEFHSGYFLRALESCTSRPFAVGSIFLRYESQFYLYALYNKNKPKSDDLMSEFGTKFFKDKQLELENKMDLSSYLLKPVQRMGKYALLLKQLIKECDRSEEGFDELKSAEEMVQFQLRHGNDLLAMDSLRDCDVNLKEQGSLLRQGEFIITERNRGKKSVRHVFLFEDLILFSKARKDPEKKTLDVFQYKQSLKTTDIGLTEQVGDNPLKFEIWFRKRKPSDTFVLQCSSREVKEAWTEEISKLLWRQALKNRKLRLCEMSSMGIGNKPCLDIRPSEDQINDRSVAMNKAPSRLRLSSSAGLIECPASVRRPHSVISVSSSSSSAGSSSHSSSTGPTFVGALNLGFESGDSPKPLQRSVTRTSQCSAESGIMSDIFPERDLEELHPKVERSNSTATNTSLDSMLSPSLSYSPSSLLFSCPISSSETSPLSNQLHQIEAKNTKSLLTTEV